MSRGEFNLSSAENYALWVASGGMCAKCRRHMILDDAGKKVNIGERAHIIGKGDRGPRREYMTQFGYTEETLDELSNLMLLCEPCHKTVDYNEINYPPELLYRMKQDHEAFVAQRLALNKKSVLVIHKRKGGPIDHVSIAGDIDSLLLDAVTLQTEFTDFTEQGWLEARSQNQLFYDEFTEAKQQYQGANIVLLALSPIPLLVHFGQLISDTVPIEIYQYSRVQQAWVKDTPEGQGTSKEVLTHTDSTHGSETLVVTMEISSQVRKSDVEAIIQNEYDHLNIKVVEPKIDAILYASDVNHIKQVFQDTLLKLYQSGEYKEIHLFYAGPAGLAVEIGRCINPTMFPTIHLYQFDSRANPRYQPAFCV